NKRGFCYMNDGDEKMAIADFEKAIEINPNYFDGYENIGLIWYDKGEFQKAIDWYSKSIKVNPASANAFAKRGSSYTYIGEFGKATDDLKLAIELAPKDVLNWQYLAQLYQQQGMIKKTLETVEKCI